MLHFNLMNPGGPFKTSSPERKLMGAKNGNGKRNGNGRNNRWNSEKELREKLGKKYYPEKSNGKGGIDDILYSPLEKKGNSVPPRQNGTKTSLPLRNKTKRFLEEAGKDHAE